jgi:hypothetical protein
VVVAELEVAGVEQGPNGGQLSTQVCAIA